VGRTKIFADCSLPALPMHNIFSEIGQMCQVEKYELVHLCPYMQVLDWFCDWAKVLATASRPALGPIRPLI